MDGRRPCGRPGPPVRSARQAQLAAFDPPPDVDGAGVEDVVEEELSFDADDEPSLDDDDDEEVEGSDALALLRLSVR